MFPTGLASKNRHKSGARGQRLRRRLPASRTLDLGEIEAFQKQEKLGRVDLEVGLAVGVTREAKGASFKSFGEEAETRAIPEKNAHLVGPAIDKDEEVSVEKMTLKASVDESRESVEAFSKVDGVGGEEDVNGRREEEHDGQDGDDAPSRHDAQDRTVTGHPRATAARPP